MSGTIPSHVPTELVLDGKLSDFLSEGQDPYLAAARLHEGPPIIWVTEVYNGKPAWVFTRHALIKEGFSKAELFSSTPGALRSSSTGKENLRLLPVESDAPLHHYYRDLLRPAFSPKAIALRYDRVKALCNELVDQFIEDRQCEFISQFASILPNAIFLEMVGMPSTMLEQFLEWEDQLIHGENTDIKLAAGAAIANYLKEFLAEQRQNPTNDIIANILNGEIDGRPITEQEIFGVVYLLFVAGLDTVYSSLGWFMHHLAQDQTLQQRLRNNPGDIPMAVEELTRAFGVSAPNRTVAKDMEFHGVTMKQGEDIILPTYLAGRDPNEFDSPHTIDIDRKPRHVTFGLGRHLCVGIHLAKQEMVLVIETFLSRMNNIHIPAGSEFSYHTTSTIGVDRLHLAWE